jgi:hypothetical protein
MYRISLTFLWLIFCGGLDASVYFGLISSNLISLGREVTFPFLPTHDRSMENKLEFFLLLGPDKHKG